MTPARAKIKSPRELEVTLRQLQKQGKKVVFTNGCFDLLHPGHVRYLSKARQLGDILVVALNTDRSVRVLKGNKRPILGQQERCEVIGALACVDFVTIFDAPTPEKIIRRLGPDVLVKGGDWPLSQIVGREDVESRGGRVLAIDFERGFSTSEIIDRIQESKRTSPPHQ